LGFDFNYVTDPPDDENVNVQTQLNDNWSELDEKLTIYNQEPGDFGLHTIPIGAEILDPDPSHGNTGRVAAWNGSEWIRALNHASTWTGWQSVDIRSPAVNRANLPVLANVNPVARRVILRGGITFDGSASAWPTNTTVEITGDAAIQPELAPIHGLCARQGATGVNTTFAGAVILIEPKTSPNRVAISVRYQGDSGGGNFVMLDGISWWF
jgi:hypothetical protein